ncbi:MAG: hypothetical protein AAF907_12140, partial [Planctomycetota bacterium]
APPPLRPSQRPTVSPFLALNETRQLTGSLNLFRNVRPRQLLLRETQRTNRELRELSDAADTARRERFRLEQRLDQDVLADNRDEQRLRTGNRTRFFQTASPGRPRFSDTGNYFPPRSAGRSRTR